MANIYTQEYAGILAKVFGVRSVFTDAMQPLQLTTGISSAETAFTVKTSASPVVNDYDKAKKIGEAGNAGRFGEMTEVVYTDVPVPYTYTLAINEGIDITTVNEDLVKATADRLLVQSEEQARAINIRIGEYISDSARVTETYDTAEALFGRLAKFYLDKQVLTGVTAFVGAEVYDAIVSSRLTTTGKLSNTNIDTNTAVMFKGIKLVATPEQYLDGNIALVVPDGAVLPFIGIEIARTIEAIDFAGQALQALAKGGVFAENRAKEAIVKVVAGGTDPEA
jgi:hypothetical protein